jgi:SOS-response transcriptional repressor LexA
LTNKFQKLIIHARMHEIQIKILSLSKNKDLSQMSFRQIGEEIGVVHPQQVKHHLIQLKKKYPDKFVVQINIHRSLQSSCITDQMLYQIPILGMANCGKPTLLADQQHLGNLTVSNSMVHKKPNLYALIASGDSMNEANVNGNSIKDGDFVIVDGDKRDPQNGDYVVSVIQGYANIKQFFLDQENQQVVLKSASTLDFQPIIIHTTDFSEYMISGTVVRVIKKPNV